MIGVPNTVKLTLGSVSKTALSFVGSKAPWFEITDKLPQHLEYAPD
jgi:hypothetical protein